MRLLSNSAKGSQNVELEAPSRRQLDNTSQY